ncbi:MAG: sulfite exporter TauE/SafE family protein [Myxococcota bacterium]|nr:sulfite exporter TauE/SafE family protein [Myxococcota bacterium]
METTELAMLVAGGFAAGLVNTLAGGGSLITVGLLVFLGLPGTLANGTNRVGVLVQNIAAAWRFRAEGVSGFGIAAPVLLPVLLGSLIGAYGISLVTPESFERLFGVVMLLLLVPVLRPQEAALAEDEPTRAPWPPALRATIFFAVGLYGGAIQAGVGIFVLFALSRGGYDLVQANSVKVVLIAALTLIAVPVFILSGQVAWPAAIALAAGFAVGGAVGARLAVERGERLIRPVLAVSVVALAGRMLGII